MGWRACVQRSHTARERHLPPQGDAWHETRHGGVCVTVASPAWRQPTGSCRCVQELQHFLLLFKCPGNYSTKVMNSHGKSFINRFSTTDPFSGRMVCDTWIWQAPIAALTLSAIQIVLMHNYPLYGDTCSKQLLKWHDRFVAFYFYCKIILISINYNYCSVLTANKCFIETELTS